MLTGAEKAVLFLLSLDEEVATPIVRELKEPELLKLRAAATNLHQVQAGAIDEVYQEFLDRSSGAVAVPRGGMGYLRRLTAGALGEDRARRVFEGTREDPLDRLSGARPEVVATLLAGESPQLVGLLLSRLAPPAAAGILAAMPPDRQAAVVDRVSRMTQVPDGVIQVVAAALVAELPSSDAEVLVGVDGVNAAAQILNASAKDASRDLLQRLEEVEPDLAHQVRLAMFTFEDLVRVDPRSMRALLREVPAERLTVALKGAPDALCEAIFRGLSQRAVELLRDDLEILGHLRKSDVEKARVEIVEIALRMEAEGALDLGRGDE